MPGAVKWGDEAPGEILAQYLHDDEQVLTTQVGERHAVDLAGGSHVILNTNTVLAAHESKRHERLDLRSDELLIETKDSRSFSLLAGSIPIEATAHAKFSVRRDMAGPTTLRVFDGAVSFLTVKLTSGRAAVIWPGRVILSRFDLATAERLLSWVDGRLVFKGDSLADVIAEFNRYNRVQIETTDEWILRARIGGSYSATDPLGFAQHLERILQIRVVRTPVGANGETLIVLTKAPRPIAPNRHKPADDDASADSVPGEGSQWLYKSRPRDDSAAITV